MTHSNDAEESIFNRLARAHVEGLETNEEIDRKLKSSSLVDNFLNTAERLAKEYEPTGIFVPHKSSKSPTT